MIHESYVLGYLKWRQAHPELSAEFQHMEGYGARSELLGYARWYDQIYLPYLLSLPEADSIGTK